MIEKFKETLHSQAQSFLNQVFKDLKSTPINVDELELDHICYRVETNERYQELKIIMQEISDLISENIISNRPISTFKLNKPIEYKDRDIWIIEIPAPKEGSFYPEGFEHAEFVINQELHSFMSLYPDIEFNTKSITKTINPEISLKLRKTKIKFHEMSLERVCEIENQSL